MDRLILSSFYAFQLHLLTTWLYIIQLFALVTVKDFQNPSSTLPKRWSYVYKKCHQENREEKDKFFLQIGKSIYGLD